MPPKQQQGQGQGTSDNSLVPFFVMLGIAGAGWFLWYKAHAVITMIIFNLKILEIKLISIFVTVPVLLQWKDYMIQTPPGMVDWSHLAAGCDAVGHYLRYPVILILAVMAFRMYTKNVATRFKRTYSMTMLRNQEQKNWPQITPVVNKNLDAEDIRLGPWAMAQTPMEFARYYNLLKKDDFAPRAVSNIDLPLTAVIKKGEARRILALQLGPYWTGFDVLPPHSKALAAAFMAKINRDGDTAAKLLAHLSITAAHGHLDITGVDELIDKYKNTDVVQELIAQHAYVLTVMPSFLESARDDGVLSSADFVWLKPIDRRLWYILNNVGRQTAFVETGGIFAHWMAEKALKNKSLMPMVEEAVKALEAAVKEVKLSTKEWGALP